MLQTTTKILNSSLVHIFEHTTNIFSFQFLFSCICRTPSIVNVDVNYKIKKNKICVSSQF